MWEAIRPRLVLGDTIAQAAQFATTGNAVGGLIAYSLVLAPGFADRGAYAVVPESDHEPLRQRMVLLKQAQPAVVQFYDYLQRDVARAILRKPIACSAGAIRRSMRCWKAVGSRPLSVRRLRGTACLA